MQPGTLVSSILHPTQRDGLQMRPIRAFPVGLRALQQRFLPDKAVDIGDLLRRADRYPLPACQY